MDLKIENILGVPEGFKKTEIGIIPTDWKIDKFENIVYDKRGGASIKPNEFTDKGILVIPKSGMVRGGSLIIAKKDIKYCSYTFWRRHQNSSVNESYLVIVLRDLVPSGPNLGLIVSIPNSGKYILAQGTYGFKTEPSKCHPSYLVQLSNTTQYRRLMQQNMVGSTQVFLRSSRLWNLKIPLPKLSEQKAIATVLTDTDDLINTLRTLIAKKKAIKQGAMQELLTGKKRLKGFVEDWKYCTIHSLCKTFTKQTGFDYSNHIKPTLVNRKTEDVIPFIQNKDFDGHKINLDTDYYVPSKIAERFPMILLDEKCFLISISGSIGKVGVFCNTKTAFIGGAVAVGKFFKPSQLDWVMFYLLSESGQNKLFKNVKAGSHQNLILDDIRKIRVPMPSEEEQKAVVHILNDMDSEIENLETQLQKNQNLKQGMMQELLTGKIRLRNISEYEIEDTLPMAAEPNETYTKETNTN